MADEVVEDFRPSSGRITGVLGLAICVGIVVLGVVEFDEGFPPAAVWAALFGGVLFWSATLRPRVRVTESELRLRNMLTTISVPLAAIEQIVVRQVLSVRAGDQRYVSSAIGKSWRQALKSDRPREHGGGRAVPGLRRGAAPAARRGRADQGGDHADVGRAAGAGQGVRREWAWPEIVLLGFTALGFVVALLA